MCSSGITPKHRIHVTRPSAGVPSYPQPFKPSGADGVPTKKRVLVVEDQSAVCDLVSEMVQSHPRCVSVGTASDGLSAIELALRLKPDILVLDVIMPGVDGGELASRIKADSLLKEVPVIFLTATVSKREAAEGVFTGGYLFLPKPVGLKNLVECMENVLAAKKHEHDPAEVKKPAS